MTTHTLQTNDFETDSQSLEVVVTSFGLMALAGMGVLAWQLISAVQNILT